MTSEPFKYGFRFSCDSCGEVFEPPRLGLGSEPRDFVACLDLAKHAGFRAFKNRRGDWEHRCSDCRGT